jgi:hypothetical protein
MTVHHHPVPVKFNQRLDGYPVHKCAEDYQRDWAMPSARAARSSTRAVLHRLGQSAGIAIAFIRANIVAAVLGMAFGMFLTVGLAAVWSLFL